MRESEGGGSGREIDGRETEGGREGEGERERETEGKLEKKNIQTGKLR